jgi:hypothetical protein
MTMRYLKRDDGTIFEGETARDAVIALRATSRTPGRDPTHFMAAVAAGGRLQTGRSIRTTTPDVFLADLEPRRAH